MEHVDLNRLNEISDLGYIRKQYDPNSDLIIWNYTDSAQYDRYWNYYTIHARGLITDSVGNVIAKGYSKFFNLEEHQNYKYFDYDNDVEKDIPLNNNFRVNEKIDGFLILIFYYNGELKVTSRGSFDNHFVDKAKKILNEKLVNQKYEDVFNKNYTYIFELIDPENSIVVEYQNEDLVLLGINEPKTNTELSFKEVEKYSKYFTVVNSYDEFYNVNQIAELVKNPEFQNREGFVITFYNGFKVKLKFQEYKRLHRLIANVNEKVIWDYLKNNKNFNEILDRTPDEFYNFVKKTKQNFLNDFESIKELAESEFSNILTELGDISGESIDKKTFAEYNMKYSKEPHLCFSLFNKKMDKFNQQIWDKVYYLNKYGK